MQVSDKSPKLTPSSDKTRKTPSVVNVQLDDLSPNPIFGDKSSRVNVGSLSDFDTPRQSRRLERQDSGTESLIQRVSAMSHHSNSSQTSLASLSISRMGPP